MMNEGVADYAIVTSYPYDWERLAQITDQLKWDYAKQHGYHFYADCSNLHGPAGARTPTPGVTVPLIGFIKMDLLLHFLPQYKAVVWMDADLLITNRDIPLEYWLNRHPDKDIIVGEDWNGFNSTVIFARNTTLARDYLWASNNTGRGFYAGDPWHEMTALRNFWLDHRYYDKIGFESVRDLCPLLPAEYEPYVPREMSDAFAWEPGAWTLHLSALNYHRRVRIAEHYADHAHHHLPPPPGPDAENP